ncbi:MAG: hypothetical protein U5L04_04405 [Trueperaceae bacterium]|nr:hypothetical protein [Trueperaceae bacterium]
MNPTICIRYALTLLCVGALLTAAAQDEFAALVIEPLPGGSAVYDIDTGYTTLADGGVIRDRESDLSITGSFIRYQEDTFIQVSGAVADGPFGDLEAAQLYYDRVSETIRASDGVSFGTGNIAMSSQELFLYLSENIALAQGEVEGSMPPLSGQALVVDIDEQDALLVGPYSYQDGPVTLSSDSAGELLAFAWQQVGEEVDFEVRSVVPAELRTRLEPYIP